MVSPRHSAEREYRKLLRDVRGADDLKDEINAALKEL